MDVTRQLKYEVLYIVHINEISQNYSKYIKYHFSLFVPRTHYPLIVRNWSHALPVPVRNTVKKNHR